MNWYVCFIVEACMSWHFKHVSSYEWFRNAIIYRGRIPRVHFYAYNWTSGEGRRLMFHPQLCLWATLWTNSLHTQSRGCAFKRQMSFRHIHLLIHFKEPSEALYVIWTWVSAMFQALKADVIVRWVVRHISRKQHSTRNFPPDSTVSCPLLNLPIMLLNYFLFLSTCVKTFFTYRTS